MAITKLIGRHQSWISSAGGWGLSIIDRATSQDIWEGLRVDPLFLCIEKSNLRWHLGKCFRHVQSGGDPEANSEHARDYIYHLALEYLCILLEELVEVTRESTVWASLLKLLWLGPRAPSRGALRSSRQVLSSNYELLKIPERFNISSCLCTEDNRLHHNSFFPLGRIKNRLKIEFLSLIFVLYYSLNSVHHSLKFRIEFGCFKLT